MNLVRFCLRVVLPFGACLLVITITWATMVGWTTRMRKDDSTDRSRHATPATPCIYRVDARNKSSWFFSKLDRKVPVFLDRANRHINTVARAWWLANMGVRDTGLDRIITELLEVVPGKSSFHEDGKTCNVSCAIVGNAGNLIGSSYGAIIDSQDVVIRMNESPTKGYEKDVGSRTTHQILYPESGETYHYGASVILLPFKPADLMWLTSVFTTRNARGGFWKAVVKTLPGAKPEDGYIIHPDFLHYVQTKWVTGHTKQKWPSAGIVALVIGVHACAKVHVMGFGLDKHGQWDHYHDLQSPIKHHYHLPDLEAVVRNQLNAENFIRLYPGNQK